MNDINLYSVIRKSTVCYLWLEDEPVFGTFFADNCGAFTGIHFRSSICPNFIKHANEIANETEQTGMTGFCAEVTDIQMRWREDDSRELCISFDEGKTMHRVHVLMVDGCIISDAPGILP